MLPLRRNLGSYCGERIHLDAVLGAIKVAAEETGWSENLLPCDDGQELVILHRSVPVPSKRIYISTGIHGDEPAGPMAVLQLLRENTWPDSCEIWLCPCLNPTGFARNTRENIAGIDLNRDYQLRETAEIRAHTDWLNTIPCFDLGIHLHEDWEAKGFYLFELNPNSLAAESQGIIDAVKEHCPIDESEEIEGFPAERGIIRPVVDPASRSDWPEALFMVQEKTNISYTLESPSDFPLPIRIRALCAAVRCLVSAD